MTMLTSPHSLPRKDVLTEIDVIATMQRSNHATAFAAWSVTTITTGLAIQIDTVHAIASRPAGLLLAALILPILATAGRATMLLVRAGRAARHAETTDTGAASDARPAPSAPTGPDRFSSIVRGLRQRDTLARRAQIWAGVSFTAFLAWSLLAALLPAGG
jgi:hypothetical protein